MKHLFRLTTVLTLLLVLSCGKDDEPVTPPNNAPEISAQSFNASEAIDDVTIIGKVTATDADNDDLSFSIKTNSNNLFEITNTGDISLAAGEALDFETATTHTLSIDVTDGEATANAEITINVIDVNENQAPLFVAQPFTIGENAALETEVGVLVAADADGDTVTFDWDPNGSVSAFQLVNDANGGRILTAGNAGGNLDFETTAQYLVSIIASDGALSTQANITINVTDENDSPVIAAQTFTAAEDVDDTFVIGTVAATDQDNDALEFRIVNDSDDLFEITLSGELSLRTGKSLDFETATTHTLTINVGDGSDIASNTFTINVTDVAENNVTVSTLAGSSAGISDGTGSAARFRTPTDVYRLTNGDFLVTDRANDAIRKVTAAGEVTTLFRNTSFGAIQSVVSDDANNLYVPDNSKSVIWKLTPSGNTYTMAVFAGTINTRGNSDGTGTAARFDRPNGLAIDDNNNLYIADGFNGAIRKITPSAVVTTVATLPIATGARAIPFDIVIAPDGTIYASDNSQHTIVKVASGSTSATTILGTLNVSGNVDEQGSNARLNRPAGMVIENNTIYVTSGSNHTVREIDLATNTITTIAGSMDGTQGYVDGAAKDARFNNPLGIAMDTSGNLFIADILNNVIRKIEFREP